MMKKESELKRLLQTLQLFYEKSHDFPTQYVVTFLHVASNQGCSNKDLMKLTGLSTAAVTRNIQALSPYRDRLERKHGYNLVHSELDPEDNRLRKIYLTNEGRALLSDVFGNLGFDEEPEQLNQDFVSGCISDEKIEKTYFPPTHKVFTGTGG